jgi:prevent-host-death family protein
LTPYPLRCTFQGKREVFTDMGQVNTVDARAQFSEIINRAAFGKERMILTRRGKEIVAVVPIEDVKLLEALEDRMDLEEAREALSEAKKKGTVSWEKMKKELGL